LELAVLEDIGYIVENDEHLNLVGQAVAEPPEKPIEASGSPQKKFLNLLGTVISQIGD
tara:strand:+ start:252 stop:425 length:174 start_codon:yes stop_codon:yes gene_type:complete